MSRALEGILDMGCVGHVAADEGARLRKGDPQARRARRGLSDELCAFPAEEVRMKPTSDDTRNFAAGRVMSANCRCTRGGGKDDVTERVRLEIKWATDWHEAARRRPARARR